MNFHRTKDVRVILPKAALNVIFDACDCFDYEETGGRVIGTFEEHGDKLTLQVTGIIDAGPRAQRTAVSFFQDGEHQERIFRMIEQNHPEIEHLGNWHTHHMNGLSTLSSGDIATYQRTVNHHNHNTPFFYALLVVAKRKAKKTYERYSIKHYIFRRDDDLVYEISPRRVDIVDTQLVWPLAPAHSAHHGDHPTPNKVEAQPHRIYDRDIIGEFYEGIRLFASQKLGLYWRGPLELVDGSKVQVVIIEDSASRGPSYSVVLRDTPDTLGALSEQLARREFPSARAAIIVAERCCNRILYEQRRHSQEMKPSG